MKEDNTGILTKDFVKKFINRENELESKITELNNTISSLKDVVKKYEKLYGGFGLADDNTTLEKGFKILLHILRYAEIQPVYNNELNSNDFCSTISINELILNNDEIDFILNVINSDHQQSLDNFNKEFDEHWEENGRGSNSKWSSHNVKKEIL